MKNTLFPSTESSLLPAARQEIFFVDASLPDLATLLAGLPVGVEVILLDTQQDGLAQIALALQGRSGLDAVHVFSHGRAGALQLGDFTLSAETLKGHADTLVQIGAALTQEGDILLYGCDVAAGQVGVDFISKLAQTTGADIAASTNLTGASALGGDWVLETSSGPIARGAYLDAARLALFDALLGGTVMVQDINNGSVSSSLAKLTAVGTTLYFTAEDGTNGVELWKSDSAGTVMVKDIYSGSIGSVPTELTNVNGTLFFRANDGINGSELWTSNGTAAGTVMVKDIATGTASSVPNNLVSVNGTLYFSAYDSTTSGTELWKSDGTSAGTVIVKDILSGKVSSSPSNQTAVGTSLFFQADDSAHGVELWKSDGTVGGTVMVKDIISGSGGAYAFELTNVNGTLYFQVNDGTHGAELWKSDGTDAGTVMVKNINSGSKHSSPASLTNVNGTLYFTANDGTNGVELWKSDGTDVGTVMVKNINSGSAHSYPAFLTNVNGVLYFSAYDGAHGNELWMSDGTTDGTVMVKDIQSGSGSAYPTNLTAIGSTLYFTADDGSNGTELWRSDGTAAGTIMVNNINSGAGSASPTILTNVNGTLFFNATDGIHGLELWSSDGDAYPILSSSTPADNATAVAIGSNIVLNFSETVAAGIGDIVISDGTDTRTIAVGDTTQVTISGSTVTINPSADLNSSSSYSVQMAPGVLKDAAGNVFAGINDATVLNFITAAPADTTAPMFTSAAVNGTDLVLTYGEALAGTAPTASQFVVTVDGHAVTVSAVAIDNPNTTQLKLTLANAVTQSQVVTIAYTNAAADNAVNTNAAIQDAAGNDAADLAALTAVTNNTPDTTAPTLSSSAPADNATAVAVGANIVLNFSEAVTAVAGKNLVIYKASDNSTITTIAADDVQISVNASMVTVNPTADLSYSTEYYVRVDAGAFKDLANNAYAGISSSTALSFTTVDVINTAPTISSVPSTVQAVTLGLAAPLPDFAVADVDGAGVTLNVTLTASNGTINGLTDADTATTGIQLSGTAAVINTALAAATFTATEAGAASIGISVSDSVAAPVTATYSLTATDAPVPVPVPVPDPVPVPVPVPVPDPVPTPIPSTDDKDNIPSAIEDAAPGLSPLSGATAVAGDGNGDGIKDSQQVQVTSLSVLNTPTAQSAPGNASSVYVSLVADSADGKVDTVHNNNAQITSLVQQDAPAGLPIELNMSLGLLNFSANVQPNADNSPVLETFSLYVDASIGANGYWVQNVNHVWCNLASAAYGGQVVLEGGKLRLDFKLVDGGEFDTDGVANGSIGNLGAAAHMPLTIVGFIPSQPEGGFWF